MINKLSDLVESEKKKEEEELLRQKNSKKQKTANIVRWVITVFLLLSVVGFFPSFTSIIMVVVALLAAPISQIQDRIPIQGIAKGGIATLLFIVGAVIAPERQTSEPVTDDSNAEEVITIKDDENEIENTIVAESDKDKEILDNTVTTEENTNQPAETDTETENTEEILVKEPAVVLESVALYVNGASAPSGTWQLTLGKEYTTFFEKIPADIEVENTTYRSSDESIAKVDANGKISALSVGSATVYVNADGIEDYVLLNISEMKQTTAPAGTSSSSGTGVGTSTSTNAEVQAYVLNSSNGKFHRPSCSKLPTKNRVDVESTHDDMIAQGYEPCKICHP